MKFFKTIALNLRQSWLRSQVQQPVVGALMQVIFLHKYMCINCNCIMIFCDPCLSSGGEGEGRGGAPTLEDRVGPGGGGQV